ncbi:hypothetical protein [uncultured Porphyromonas sp.]|uniref:hypothetical protein n=1 Tax=uncultured Porphyromonas sp. TaxID=159274 RepID=UPI002611F931|nr:hypothetical protein [uncultured Porphyromonas sp.]
MAQKKINYELLTWTLIPYFIIIFFIKFWCELPAEGEPNLMPIVVGLSTLPIVAFLVMRLFALIAKKRKKEVILPRWIDLLFVYLLGFAGALTCLSHSTRAFWVAVPILMLFACIFMLIKAFVATRPEPKE